MRRAPRYCSADPRCGNLTDGGACSSCKAKRDRARGTSTERGYDVAWSAYSKHWIAVHRWCGERADGRLSPEHSACVRAGLRTPAECTDHIRAMRHGGAKFDPRNHQSLCLNCNRRKSIAHEGGFARVAV